LSCSSVNDVPSCSPKPPRCWAKTAIGSARTSLTSHNPRFDLHVVRRARRVLLLQGDLVELSATFPSGREVKALVYGPAYRDRGRQTETIKEAARKRRLYHTYLSWTHDPSKCGAIAERIVLASMKEAQGLYGVPRSPGNVRAIEGQAIEGGKTLDATAVAVVDLEKPTRGGPPPAIPIGVEVKNVRQALYPTSTEVWDLLTKVATFPDVVPILICRLAQITLFRMFADIGAATLYTQRQFFSASIPRERFERVTDELGFSDALRVEDPDRRRPAIVGFFEKSIRAPRVEEPADPRPLLVRARERWERASEIVGNYSDLAENLEDEQDRDALFAEFRSEIDSAGLRAVAGW
jgi:hypothetical protein